MPVRTRDNHKLFRNILTSIILTIVCTLLISSTILYLNFNNIALRQAYRSDSNSLTETSRAIASTTEIASKLSIQIYRDYAITKLFYYEDPSIYDVTFAMEQLTSYRIAMPFIESIYVYSGISDMFYVSSDDSQSGLHGKAALEDQSIVDILDHFQDYRPFYPIPRTYAQGSDDQAAAGVYSFLCYDALNANHRLNSAVVVNISESWINRNAGKPLDPAASNEMIVNAEGVLLSTNGADPILTNYAGKTFIQEIADDPNDSGYRVDRVDGMKALISYTGPDALGWRYIRITPYAQITEETRSMRFTTIYIGLGILFAGLFVSFLASKKLYKPIDAVLRRIRALEAEQRSSLQLLRQDFLRKVLQGLETYSSTALAEQLERYGSPIRLSNASRLLLLRIDRYQETVQRYQEEIRLFRYAILNAANKSGKPLYDCEAIDMGEDRVVLLLAARDNEPMPEESVLSEWIRNLQDKLREELKLSVSVTMSPFQASVEQSIGLYPQVAEASLHRLFRGPGCLIHSELIMAYKTKAYAYPVHKEKHMIEALMQGKAADAERIYTEIVDETAEYPYSVVQLAISHLMLTTDNVIHTVSKNNALSIQPDFVSSLVSLNQAEKIEEIHQHFYRLFRELQRKLEEKRNTRHEDLVHKINEIIERDFSDPNLCLNSIADEIDRSPMYISRWYKQQTAIAITDLIQEVRMEQAKAMLVATNLSVSNIAERTGFTSSSYFYRMFKKCNGVTPNDYRKQFMEPRQNKEESTLIKEEVSNARVKQQVRLDVENQT